MCISMNTFRLQNLVIVLNVKQIVFLWDLLITMHHLLSVEFMGIPTETLLISKGLGQIIRKHW